MSMRRRRRARDLDIPGDDLFASGALLAAMATISDVLRRIARRVSPPERKARKDDGIEFAYAPRRDGDADPGEVVWGWVPFEDDPTQGKDRPIAVVGYWGADLCGVPLTSKNRDGDRDRLPVGPCSWDREQRPSYACLDRVMRLAPAAVRREGAALDQGRYVELVDALRARR
jgi:hypothetical protein